MACWHTHVCMAIPEATPALIERVEPNIVIECTRDAATRAGCDRPGPSWPKSRTQRRGSCAVSSGVEPGRLSIPMRGTPLLLHQARRSSMDVVVDVLVAVGDHCSPPVPAPPSHDVHRGGSRRVRVADDGPDVEVVLPVLDGDVEGVADRSRSLTIASTPVAVAVDDVPAVAFGEKLGSSSGSSGQGSGCGPDPMSSSPDGSALMRCDAIGVRGGTPTLSKPSACSEETVRSRRLHDRHGSLRPQTVSKRRAILPLVATGASLSSAPVRSAPGSTSAPARGG